MMTHLIPWRRTEIHGNGSRPSAPVSQMRMDWDRLFDRLLDDAWSPLASAQGLPLDLTETDDEIRVKAEVPGIEPDDLEISLAGDQLTLSGKKADEHEEESSDGARHYSERQFGSFQRTVRLTCPVDPEKVSAEHKNGVVTITLRKAETIRPRRITVKAT